MKKTLNIAVVLAALSVITYCSSNYFGRQLTRNSSNTPAVVTETCSSSGDCVITNKFDAQPTQAGKFWPEIVFIGDTSPSMRNNYAAIATSLPQWIARLQDKGIENFCVGYMPGHAGRYSGLYYAPSGYPKCLCYGDYSVEEIVEKLGYILNHTPTEDYLSDGVTKAFSQRGEVPLYSLQNAVTNSDKVDANQSAGCMRNEYTLSPILVADENDLITAVDGPNNLKFDNSGVSTGNACAGKTQDGVAMDTITFDNSIFPAIGANDQTNIVLDKNSSIYNPADSSCQEQQGRYLYYSKKASDGGANPFELIMTPESIANDLVEYNGALPTFGSSVGFKPQDAPDVGFQGQDGPFWGGIEFADEFGQDMANLKYVSNGDQEKFNDELNGIADALAKTVTFHYVFDLKDEEGNAAAVCETKLDSLVVKVDGKTVDSSDYTLNSARTRVTFKKTYDWDFGDSVTITFETCE